MDASEAGLNPKVVIEMSGNAAARNLAATERERFYLLGQKRCTCPKKDRLINVGGCKTGKSTPLSQDITDPQLDCPRCGYDADVL